MITLHPDTDPNADTRAGDQVGDLVAAVRHAESALTRTLTAVLAPTGLVVTAFAVLHAFAQGAATAGEVTRVLHLSDRVVWNAVRHLEHHGCITRTGAPGTWGRRVTLTPQGHEIYQQAATLVREAEERLLDDLGEATRLAPIDLFRRLAEAAETHPG